MHSSNVYVQVHLNLSMSLYIFQGVNRYINTPLDTFWGKPLRPTEIPEINYEN